MSRMTKKSERGLMGMEAYKVERDREDHQKTIKAVTMKHNTLYAN